MSWFGGSPGNRPDLTKKKQVRVLVDPLALILIALSVSLFLNLGTFVDYDSSWTIKALLGLGFLVSGAVLSITDQGGVGWRLDASFDRGEIVNFVSGVAMAFITIVFTNVAVSRYISLSPIPVIAGVLFVQMIGVAEEIGVRGYLLNLVSNLTGDDLSAVLLSSAVGTTFHSAVYGTREPQVFIIVFVSFFVLGWIYVMTQTTTSGVHERDRVPARRISTVMTAHSLVNTMSALRGSSVYSNMFVVLWRLIA